MKLSNRTEKIIGISFSIIGVVLLILSVIFFINLQTKKNSYRTVTGYVSAINDVVDNKYFVIDYTVNDVLYSIEVSNKDSSIKLNDKYKVYYNSDNPSDGFIDNDHSSYILFFISLIFIVIGFTLVSREKYRNQKRDELMEFGKKVNLKVLQIKANNSFHVNTKHPYRIICEYEKNGTLYSLISNNFWISDFDIYQDNLYVDVYIDTDDIGKYYIDPLSMKKK